MAYTTINKPSDYFNTKLYTGNGADRSITGVGFQPDWIWVKERTGTSEHRACNSTTGSKNVLFPSANFAEQVDQYGTIDSFDADGFSITTGTTNSNYVGLNVNGVDMVTWHWKANGGTTSSNTDGSITSTVQANTTSGFSIVSYTGTGANATVGHGLGVAPKMIIFKNRTVARNWISYHDSIGATKFMYFNLTNAEQTDSTAFNNTAPTSSVFSLGSNVGGNESGSSMIAYCFAEVKGFSKFGSYVGNGNADGSFIYLGFKPAMVILKDYTSASNYNWVIIDNKRDPSNSLDRRLQPSTNFAEYTDVSDFCDFTSNGIKWRGSQGNWNASGVGYIYMAFAEEPLVGDNPATAR